VNFPFANRPARRWDAVTRAIDPPLLGPVTLTMLVAVMLLVGGSWLTMLIASGQHPIAVIAIVAVGAIATGVVAAFANAFARPPTTRRAFEAFVYLGEWEMDRVQRLAQRPFTPSVGAMRKLIEGMEESPETRWLRVELLTTSGDLDGARAMAERMPGTTAYQRLERQAALVLLDWLAGGSGDPAPVRDALDEIEPEAVVPRRCAEVVLACTEVRYRVGRGDSDPTEPLRIARDRLGAAADDVLLRMTRRSARSFVTTAGWFTILLVVLDWSGIL
jgi:hypothetical protein